MTGAEHYQKAEQWLSQARERWEAEESADLVQAAAQVAQVHATLALAAATALSQSGEMYVPDAEAWEQAASAHTRAAVPS